MKEIENSEQKVLFIPKPDLNLDEGWRLVSSKASEFEGRVTDGQFEPGVFITVRKTTDLTKAETTKKLFAAMAEGGFKAHE